MPLQEENEEEEELLDGLAACLTAVLRNYGDSAITLMDGLMPKLGTLLDASRSSEERRVGICIVDDILEHSAACKCSVNSTIPLCHCRLLSLSEDFFFCRSWKVACLDHLKCRSVILKHLICSLVG